MSDTIDYGVLTCLLRSEDPKKPEQKRNCEHTCGTCGWNAEVLVKRMTEEPKKLKNGLYGYETKKGNTNG